MGGGGATETESKAKANKLISIAGNRKDCVAFISPDKSNVVGVSDSGTQTTNIVDFFTHLRQRLTLSSIVVGSIFMTASLTSIDGSHVTVTLQDYVLAPLLTGDPWFSPAGLEPRWNQKCY